MGKKRQDTPNRYRESRSDASVKTTQQAAEKALGLPKGSVKIVLPSGRKAREDGSIESLRNTYKGKKRALAAGSG